MPDTIHCPCCHESMHPLWNVSFPSTGKTYCVCTLCGVHFHDKDSLAEAIRLASESDEKKKAKPQRRFFESWFK